MPAYEQSKQSVCDFFLKTDISATRLKVGIKDSGNFLI